jgi:hypothetical protein
LALHWVRPKAIFYGKDRDVDAILDQPGTVPAKKWVLAPECAPVAVLTLWA